MHCLEYNDEALQSESALCGVHIERTSVDKHSKQIVLSTFVDDAKDDIRMLRNDVGSQAMFNSLTILVREEWIRRGEIVFANSFSKEYFEEPYNRWNINSFADVYANPIENQTVEASHRNDKRLCHGAGSKTKVSLSEYVTRSIPRLLETYTRDYSGREITLEPQALSTGYPDVMLTKAKILLHQIVDDRVKYSASSTSNAKSHSKIVHAANFFHLPPGSTIVTGKPKSVDGYIVFNSANNYVQDYGPGKGVTKEIALQYIDCVFNGRFPRTASMADYESKKLFVRGYHLLTYKVVHIDSVPVYEHSCFCKDHRGQGECEHEAAGSNIIDTFDVDAQVQQIQRGCVRGRPRKIPSVGYAARKIVDSNTDSTTSLHASDYEKMVHEKIVQFFNKPFSAQPFVGSIQGVNA
jgi:hypothetical protein